MNEVQILLFVYGIILIPCVISKLNLSNSWLGFWGSYVGAVIGGIITIAGVYFTLKSEREKDKKTEEEKIIPDIYVTFEPTNFVNKLPQNLKITFISISTGIALNISLFNFFRSIDDIHINSILPYKTAELIVPFDEMYFDDMISLVYYDINMKDYYKSILCGINFNEYIFIENISIPYHITKGISGTAFEKSIVNFYFYDQINNENHYINELNKYYKKRSIPAEVKKIYGDVITLILIRNFSRRILYESFKYVLGVEPHTFEVLEGDADIY